MNETSVWNATRREFVRLAAAAAAFGPRRGYAGAASRSIPRRPLGSRGLFVPILGVGTATAGHELDRTAAIELFHAALDAGAGYFDTAPAAMGYGRAAEWLAPVLRERRDEAFVVTKVFTDDGDRASRLFDENLEELGIERADLTLIHSVGDARIDLRRLLSRRGALAALELARADGRTRAIGISAHDRPRKVLELIRSAGPIDAVMIPVDHPDAAIETFEATVAVEAHRRNAGWIAFKLLRGAERASPSRVAERLFRAWDRPGLATAVVGFSTCVQLQDAVSWAHSIDAGTTTVS